MTDDELEQALAHATHRLHFAFTAENYRQQQHLLREKLRRMGPDKLRLPTK